MSDIAQIAKVRLTSDDVLNLKIFAANIRKATFQAIAAVGAGHIGGAMSMVEVLAVLYGKVLAVDHESPSWPERDRVVLSKGHAGPSLYGTLALRGFFPLEELATMNQNNTRLPSHADRNKTPGIDFSTGPLGQGISMAIGSAVGAHKLRKDYYTYAILGDGECNEGQVWESILFGAQHNVSNLIVFVDYNKQQLAGWVRDISKLDDLSQKFAEFGWFSQNIDGHDIMEIYDAIQAAKAETSRPSVIVLNTIKGKGCAKAERAGLCHHMPFSQDDYLEESSLQNSQISMLEAQKDFPNVPAI